MDNTAKAELAEKIAEVIAERGFARNTYEQPNGSVCLLGAGRVAQDVPCHWTTDTRSAQHAADANTAEALDFLSGSFVVKYNDFVVEDKKGAIDFVISVAKKWRNEG